MVFSLQEFDFDIIYLKGPLNFSDVRIRGFVCNKLNVKGKNRNLCVPKPDDEETIIKEYQELTGHEGPDAIKYLINARYKFAKLINKKINAHCKNCEICI